MNSRARLAEHASEERIRPARCEKNSQGERVFFFVYRQYRTLSGLFSERGLLLLESEAMDERIIGYYYVTLSLVRITCQSEHRRSNGFVYWQTRSNVYIYI